MDFTKLSADELLMARRGQIAAREGAHLDTTQPEAWQAGWMMEDRQNWAERLRASFALPPTANYREHLPLEVAA